MQLVVAGKSNCTEIHCPSGRFGRVTVIAVRRLRARSVIVRQKIAGHESNNFDAALLKRRCTDLIRTESINQEQIVYLRLFYFDAAQKKYC